MSCVARDAQGRQATCGFSVSLSATTLTATRFVAFGDSVTEGQNGRTIGGHRVVDVPNAYPTKLQSLFDFEFPGQGITVINEGKGGVFLDDDVRRLPAVLTADHPDALLRSWLQRSRPCPPGGAAHRHASRPSRSWSAS